MKVGGVQVVKSMGKSVYSLVILESDDTFQDGDLLKKEAQ